MLAGFGTTKKILKHDQELRVDLQLVESILGCLHVLELVPVIKEPGVLLEDEFLEQFVVPKFSCMTQCMSECVHLL